MTEAVKVAGVVECDMSRCMKVRPKVTVDGRARSCRLIVLLRSPAEQLAVAWNPQAR